MRFRFLGTLVSMLLFAASCTKIDTTSIGSGLIPDVDNVHTFDTSLQVFSNTYLFNDSTRLAQTYQHAIGSINADPLFGTVRAELYTEIKPTAYPVNFFTKDSLISLDSVVLSLTYKGAYGDTLAPVNYRVFEVTGEQMEPDSSYKNISYPAFYKFDKTFPFNAQFIGERFYPNIYRIATDSAVIVRNNVSQYKVVNQIRIKLNSTNLNKVFTDSASSSTDSLLKVAFKGFRITADIPGAPGALTYISLTDTTTKLQFFYRRHVAGAIDTTINTFYCGSNSGHANNVVRNRTGSEMLTRIKTDPYATTQPANDSVLYLHTTPGSFVKLRIPDLKDVTNRIVHRAELRIVQIPESFDTKLLPPAYLYLDRFDTASERKKFKAIPMDLNPASNYFTTCFPSTDGVDYTYFGGVRKLEVIDNKQSYVYNFNITRYVQSIVTNHERVSDFRLSSSMFAEYFDCFGNSYIPVTGNRVAEGRVKVGGGAVKNSTWKYKLELRIIYSKL